ncbi:MAG: hypothetical protein ACX93T_03640 [Bacteroidota bacterium]
MYVPFNQLSDEARIWVYQANRPLEREEQAAILQQAQTFLAQWTSHGNPLQCSAELCYDQFLILGVEEKIQGATGCAVDSSVQFIRMLEEAFQVSLLDRTYVAFRHNAANLLVPLDQLKATIQQGTILEDTLTFDNTITHKKALSNQWLIRSGDAWFSKYFYKP